MIIDENEQVSVDDLISYLAKSSRLSSAKLEHIEKQQSLKSSPISKWFERFFWKIENIEKIDWDAIFHEQLVAAFKREPVRTGQHGPDDSLELFDGDDSFEDFVLPDDEDENNLSDSGNVLQSDDDFNLTSLEEELPNDSNDSLENFIQEDTSMERGDSITKVERHVEPAEAIDEPSPSGFKTIASWISRESKQPEVWIGVLIGMLIVSFFVILTTIVF